MFSLGLCRFNTCLPYFLHYLQSSGNGIRHKSLCFGLRSTDGMQLHFVLLYGSGFSGLLIAPFIIFFL